MGMGKQSIGEYYLPPCLCLAMLCLEPGVFSIPAKQKINLCNPNPYPRRNQQEKICVNLFIPLTIRNKALKSRVT
jgi:hypothetical protein